MSIVYVPQTTSKANRIKIDDVNDNFESNNVEGALIELAGNVSGNLTEYQKKADQGLATTSKEVIGAINENNSEIKKVEKNKVDKVEGKVLSSNDYTTTEKNKLSGIGENANNYSHPPTHESSIITQDATHRFVSDAEKTTWNGKSSFSGSYNDLKDKPSIPVVTNDLTAALKTNYDAAYTHSQGSHAPNTAQKNSDITKTEIEAKLTGEINSHTHVSAAKMIEDSIVNIDIVEGVLTLTGNKYQTTSIVDATEIVLPTVTSFKKIHLFFSASSDMTLTLPTCKWQTNPTFLANKDYELIFTYTDKWLGKVIVYE